ncbi:MAG TPA: GNAT family N-acetyltransferase [Candidatus Polarisedimenticolia bacterium]|nr:GNAT family N-acetyltransferase [Candidatus Polarisedimenticolia bacterium]
MNMRGAAVLEPGSPSAVTIVDRPAFIRMEKEWNALVETTSDQPFYRHEYLRSWMDHFVPDATLKILTGRDHAGTLVAALPLVADRGFLYGLPVRRLVSPTSVHSGRFDLIAADRRSAARSFLRTLADDDTWDMIRITDVPAGGNAWDLYAAALEAGFPAGAWESQRSPFLALPASYDKLEARLSSKFKANLRRRRRRLEERGDVRVECVTGGGGLERRLEDHFALERSGWKGRKGTAAAQSSRTRGFYTGLAHGAARGDYLSLSSLHVAGRAIASQYGLARRGVYSLLMTCYDETWSEYSPGNLLMETVMQRCVAGGLSEFDFLGCDLGWKLDWSPTARAHHWFFIFRDNRLGWMLKKAKFDWIPAAKEGLRRWTRRQDAGTQVVSSH